jgi:hypothetical protein
LRGYERLARLCALPPGDLERRQDPQGGASTATASELRRAGILQ